MPEITLRPFTLDLLTEYSTLCAQRDKAKHELFHCAEELTQNREELHALAERYDDAQHACWDYRRTVETFFLRALEWTAHDDNGYLERLLADLLQERFVPRAEHDSVKRELARAIVDLEQRLARLEDRLQAAERRAEMAERRTRKQHS